MLRQFVFKQQSPMLAIVLCALIWTGGYGQISAPADISADAAIEFSADQEGDCSKNCLDATLVSH